jgi:capsular exopolysaccharide synthesis family protein
MSLANPKTIRVKQGTRLEVAAEQGISAQFLLNTLRHWWKIVLPAGLLLAMAASAVVVHFFQRQYEAVAWLRIDEKPTHLAFDSTHEERPQGFANTQVELLRSPPVLQSVAREADTAAFLQIVSPRDPLLWLTKGLSVKSVGQSELYKLSIMTPEPKLSAQIVNSVLDSYFKLRSQDENERLGLVIKLLEEEQQRRAGEVAAMRESVQALGANAAADPGDNRSLPAEAGRRQPLAELQVRLINAEVERQVLEAKIKAAEESETSPEAGVSDRTVDQAVEADAEVAKLKTLLAGKRSKLHEIAARSANGDRNPLYRQLQAEIAEEEQKLQQLCRDLGQKVRADLAASADKKQAGERTRLRADLEAHRAAEELLRQRYESLDEGQLEAAAKRAELARAEKAFELIADRVAKLRTEQRAPGRVSLLERAEIPLNPVEMYPLRPITLVSLLGLLLPALLAVAWERFTRRIHDPECLEQRSDLAVLAEVPRLPPRTVPRDSLPRHFEQQLRMVEESIDALATSLLLGKECGEIRVLAVTSAMPSEGKTSVASRLAVSLARASGEPTLLVDGDLRSPDIHRVFDVREEPGLAEVLAGRCSPEQAIITDGNEHVHLLPAGRLAGNPHSLLGAGKLESLLQELGGRYRHIVLDTPPVLAAGEALVLAKAAGACLICAKHGASRMSQVEKARERLESVGCRLAGIVLNGVPVRHYTYRYGSYAYANA